MRVRFVSALDSDCVTAAATKLSFAFPNNTYSPFNHKSSHCFSFQSLRWAWQPSTVVWTPPRPATWTRPVRSYERSTCRRASPLQRELHPATAHVATKRWGNSSTACRQIIRTSCSSVHVLTPHAQSDGARPLFPRARMRNGKNRIAWLSCGSAKTTTCASRYCVWKWQVLNLIVLFEKAEDWIKFSGSAKGSMKGSFETLVL